MLLRRLYNDQLAQASYLIACQASREAIVIDPVRDPALYLDAARQDGVRITMVTETHVHADFLSGASALAAAADAELLLSGEGDGASIYARAAFPSARWLREGDELRVGRVRLDVMHLPGHTPEHISFIVTDEATSEYPGGMLSGDFLFVGDVGRPDLLERAVGAAGTMESAARQLYRSLQRVRDLPEFVQIWPGHGAGSACGKALGAVPQSTLGYELRANWAFGVRDESRFVAEVLAGQPEPPPYFARMKRRNAAGVGAMAAPITDDVQALRAALAGGAVLVDTRPPEQFGSGHARGSLNVPLGKSFLAWAGNVLDAERDLVLLATPATRALAERAASALSLIGMDRVLGVLSPADVADLTDAPLQTVKSAPASTMNAPAPGVMVLDVRNGTEWGAGHVPGAVHLPLPELTARLHELRGRGPLLVHCQGGARSAVAASVLLAAGFDDVTNIDGGFAAWVLEGHRPATDG